MKVFEAPRGVGPYGITATPKGEVWYASLAGNYIARIDPASGQAAVVEPPTPKQGSRRIWSDSRSRLWVSEWNSGNVSLHDPADGSWKAWKLPGASPRTYAVYVDNKDKVWLTDFSANAIVRFDPADGEIQRVRERQAGRQRAPTRRAQWRGMGRRIRHRSPGHDPDRRADVGLVRSAPLPVNG